MTPFHSAMSAYEKGRQDYEWNESLEANPYTGDLADEWKSGWLAARDTDEISEEMPG